MDKKWFWIDYGFYSIISNPICNLISINKKFNFLYSILNLIFVFYPKKILFLNGDFIFVGLSTLLTLILLTLVHNNHFKKVHVGYKYLWKSSAFLQLINVSEIWLIFINTHRKLRVAYKYFWKIVSIFTFDVLLSVNFLRSNRKEIKL